MEPDAKPATLSQPGNRAKGAQGFLGDGFRWAMATSRHGPKIQNTAEHQKKTHQKKQRPNTCRKQQEQDSAKTNNAENMRTSPKTHRQLAKTCTKRHGVHQISVSVGLSSQQSRNDTPNYLSKLCPLIWKSRPLSTKSKIKKDPAFSGPKTKDFVFHGAIYACSRGFPHGEGPSSP